MSSNTIFVCSKCDAQFPKWSGRCLECGSWGTLNEEVRSKKEEVSKSVKKNYQTQAPGEVIKLGGVQNRKLVWHKTGLAEFDRVLGDSPDGEAGGLPQGALIMLGGDPGVGKSTLALLIAAKLGQLINCLYVSAEEHLDQISRRLSRLSVKNPKALGFLNETKLETILATMFKEQPQVAIIDSIQTVYTEELSSEAGSINQVKACTVKLLEYAKSSGCSIIIIGQVNKTGQVAGPKAAEHLVDAVLYLEGDRYKQFRILRAAKNRFGSTSEIGVWQMAKDGLQQVLNPSEVFLSGATKIQPGTVITPVAEGSRIFLVEAQALLSKTTAYYPRRTAAGFNPKRLDIIATVLSKRSGVKLNNFDIVVNIAGGLKIAEPALDLAVAAAIISAWQDKPIQNQTVMFGEVGLSGELRPVNKTKERIKEALKLGFKHVVLPYFGEEVRSVDLIKLKDLNELVEYLR